MWKDFVANGVADKFAGIAAARHQLDPNVIRRVDVLDSIIPLVTRRVAAVDVHDKVHESVKFLAQGQFF